MNDCIPRRSLEDLEAQEAGPYASRVTYPGDIALRRFDFQSAGRQIQAEWNRYIGTLTTKGAKSMFKNLVNRLQIFRTISELNKLDDRILADIGVARSDIPAVARRVTDALTQPVEAQKTITPTATVTEIPVSFTTEATNTDEHRKAA